VKIGAGSFTRNRSLNFPTIIALIVNLIRKTIQVELNIFMDRIDKKGVTKQALSKARKKLSPQAFQLLNDELVKEYYLDNEIKLFHGFRVLISDGSTVQLPETDEIRKTYGWASNQSNRETPVGRISILFDPFNDIIIHSLLAPYKIGETELFDGHLSHLDQITTNPKLNDLIILDRGYQSTELMLELKEKNKNFIIRAGGNTCLSEVKEIAKTKSDSIITIQAQSKDNKLWYKIRKFFPGLKKQVSSFQLRVIVLNLKNNKQVTLVTSLLSQTQYPPEFFKETYHIRWEVEEKYKHIKKALFIENFSGHLCIVVEQDFYATVFTCNAASLVAQEAQDEIDREHAEKKYAHKYKINRNIAFGMFKNELIDVLLGDCDLATYLEKIKAYMKQSLVQVVPERNFPRVFRRGVSRKTFHTNSRSAL
jgi:hypothetical protein